MRRVLVILVLGLGLSWAERAPGQAADEGTVKSLQERIQSDPALMGKVTALQKDEDFMAVLGDPQIAAAVERGDLGALLANPKVGKLMNNATVLEITRDLEP